MKPATEVARIEWAEGERRLNGFEGTAARRASVELVVRELVDELYRRVGATFTLDELADEYAGAAAWCLDIAQRVTDLNAAHDLSIVQDAAFARFARDAIDYRD
ncbi:MAG TPA: hypothetical protein VFQ71_03305 [Gaiellales bacterium]|nr:hypothetical protein [Gaiellales bacterium]